MRNKQWFSKSVLIFSCLLSISMILSAAKTETYQINVGKWLIEYDKSTKKTKLIKDGQTILSDLSVNAKVDGVMINSSDYSSVNLSNSTESDEIGTAEKYIIEHKADGKATIQQIFYLYADKDFFLTEVILKSPSAVKISSNYIAPIYTTSKNSFLPSSVNNRMLTVPYDNDGFITYGSFALTSDTLSFEVTSIFNGDSQNGLVIGSVEHNIWKTGIRISASDNEFINKFECFNGVTHHATRDNAPKETVVNGESVKVDYIMPHGSISGVEVKSSRILLGYFSDWRTSLETYGEVNELIAPKRNWDKGNIFGWSSWGSMQEHVNLEGVKSVSDFMKNNLQNNNFENDNTVYINLDSYWDNLNDEQLKEFADHCYANGQIPGVYWSPFRDWFGWSRGIEGSPYNYSEAWTFANGQPKQMGGVKCMDPTHPGTRDRMRYFVNRFKTAGFKYIKLDFLVDGAVEGDSFYQKNIVTGTQAYNYGMNYFKELCGEDIFLLQSISPLFPANYSHSRRISCDAWGEMWHTQYMMNSLSFGWWLDRVYVFNDADHLVMGDRSEGENRARVTSGAITGVYLMGDNLSTAGNYVGTVSSQEKVKKFATNPYINEMAKIGKSFRPAYGHIPSSESGATDLFYYETGDYYYIAYFNYNSSSKTGYLDLASLDIDFSTVSGGRECWTKTPVTVNKGKLLYSIPGKDARVYQLFKKTSSIEKDEMSESQRIDMHYNKDTDNLAVSSTENIDTLKIFSLQGVCVLTQKVESHTDCFVDVSHISKGGYVVLIETAEKQILSTKFLK